MSELSHQAKVTSRDEQRTLECMRWLAESNYQISFSPSTQISERIVFPGSANESNGIEDARFVRFIDDDGSAIYYGTYTAYNGHVILPQLLETRDFLNFSVLTLNGSAAKNKGMALFPRRINGDYVMLSRQDDENLYLIYSDNPHCWNHPRKIIAPKQSWEMVKLGNCGSPIETAACWLAGDHPWRGADAAVLYRSPAARPERPLKSARPIEPAFTQTRGQRAGRLCSECRVHLRSHAPWG
jgi:predicted GH43/DUF377 family glycosyl hydrolase